MSDTPDTKKVFDWLYSRNAGRVSSFIGINRAQVRMEDLERERNQWKDIAERSIGYVYENDWDPWACDIIEEYETLAGGPHPIHSR